jgi:hypothetical protein
MSAAIPFGAVTIHRLVEAVEDLFGLNDREPFTASLPAHLRRDIGLVELGKPVILDPLIQILAAGRR